MKLSAKIAAISIFVFLHWAVSIAGMNYAQTELVSFAWGDSLHQIYYYESEQDLPPFSAKEIKIGDHENAYISFDENDFRKFDKTGELLYQLPIYVVNSAVGVDGYFYYEYLGGLDTVKIIEPAGTVLKQQFVFTDYGDSCWIFDIIRRGPNALYCGEVCTYELMPNSVKQISYQLPYPRDSFGYYYSSPIAAMKGLRDQAKCYHQTFLDLLKTKMKDSLTRVYDIRDTIRIQNIGSHPLEGAEVLGVDNNDNIYVWLFYGFNDYPMEMVVLSNSLVEQYRFLFKSYNDSKNLIWRPQVNEDGTVYEFRVEPDGVHIVKWTREP